MMQSRVIKSMVIEGLRYGSNPLLEMRIHDLALLTDLSRHDPNHPDDPPPSGDPEEGMACDGTYEMKSRFDAQFAMTSESKQRAENALYDGATKPDPHWTGPWPLLHIPVELAVETCYAFFEIVVDLLANAELATLSMIIPPEDGISDSQIQERAAGLWGELLAAWSGQIGILGISLRVALQLLDAVSLIPVPTFIATMSVLYASWLLLFGVWVYAMISSVDQGFISPGAAAAGFIVMAISFIGFMAGGLASKWKEAKFFWEKYKATSHKFWKSVRQYQFLYTVTVIIAKVSAFVTCLILGLYYSWLHSTLYGW
ncbi:MAG: hypothetical protein EAX95_10095 [Candidatus Thorarchaeota archaeon]|nr:hypothetical protein [Candidatus Thorarchaeota archaeon]